MDSAPDRFPPREAILAAGRAAGFTAVGVASCEPSEHGPFLERWLARGAHAGMTWLAETAEIRKDLRSKWEWARSALVGVASYLTAPPRREELPGIARFVSRYARGADYHEVLKKRLSAWGDAVERLTGRPVRRAALVDTSALLERELAVRAGLGWVGRNSCLIGPHGDSWRFIGVLLTDLAGAPAEPRLQERCGECRACLLACPTGAITEPYFVDANRCLSYLTIEQKGPIPREYQPALGDWLFGCDRCQEVCPWNKKAEPVEDPAFQVSAQLTSISLAELLRLNDAEFRARFRGLPLARPKRSGVLRNALLVAFNTGDREALAEAEELVLDSDPVIAATAAFVTGRTSRNESNVEAQDAQS